MHHKNGFFGVEEICLLDSPCGCFGPPDQILVNFICGLCFERFEEDHRHDLRNRKVIISSYSSEDEIPVHLDVCVAQMVGALMFDPYWGKETFFQSHALWTLTRGLDTFKWAKMETPEHHSVPAREVLSTTHMEPPYRLDADKVPDKFLSVVRENWKLGIYRTSRAEAVLWTTVPHTKVMVENAVETVFQQLQAQGEST